MDVTGRPQMTTMRKQPSRIILAIDCKRDGKGIRGMIFKVRLIPSSRYGISTAHWTVDLSVMGHAIVDDHSMTGDWPLPFLQPSNTRPVIYA